MTLQPDPLHSEASCLLHDNKLLLQQTANILLLTASSAADVGANPAARLPIRPQQTDKWCKREPGRGDEIAGVFHSEVHVVAQQPRVQQLPHVLALVVGCAAERGQELSVGPGKQGSSRIEEGATISNRATGLWRCNCPAHL